MAKTVHISPDPDVDDLPRSHGPARRTSKKDDVASEPYRGPGALLTGAGYIQLTHLTATGIAIVIGGILGAIYYPWSLKLRRSFENFAKDGNRVFFKEDGYVTWFVRRIPKWAENIASHIPGAKKRIQASQETGNLDAILDNPLTQEDRNIARSVAGIFIGGISGALTWVGAALWGLVAGRDKSLRGRDQFERARSEIWDLRAQYDSLREKYIRTRIELDELKTTTGVTNGTLRVSHDEPPRLRDASIAENNAPKRRDDNRPGTVVNTVTRDAAVAAQNTNSLTT